MLNEAQLTRLGIVLRAVEDKMKAIEQWTTPRSPD
jgi:hypothetical protein